MYVMIQSQHYYLGLFHTAVQQIVMIYSVKKNAFSAAAYARNNLYKPILSSLNQLLQIPVSFYYHKYTPFLCIHTLLVQVNLIMHTLIKQPNLYFLCV